MHLKLAFKMINVFHFDVMYNTNLMETLYNKNYIIENKNLFEIRFERDYQFGIAFV